MSSPARRIQVAVVLSASGTVFSDALAPYEVIARSARFSIAAVAAEPGPAPVQAGPRITLTTASRGQPWRTARRQLK